MTVSKKSTIVIGGTIVIALGVATIGWLTREKNAQAVAERFRDCFLAADAGCIRTLVRDDELLENELDDEMRLRAFLTNVIRPRLRGRIDVGRRDIIGDGKYGHQTFVWYVETERGEVALPITVGKTEVGLRVIDPLSMVVLSICSLDKEGTNRTGTKKYATWAENLQAWQPELESHGFRRIRIGIGEQSITLSQFREWCQRRIEATDSNGLAD